MFSSLRSTKNCLTPTPTPPWSCPSDYRWSQCNRALWRRQQRQLLVLQQHPVFSGTAAHPHTPTASFELRGWGDICHKLTVIANNCRNVQHLTRPVHRYSLKNVYTMKVAPATTNSKWAFVPSPELTDEKCTDPNLSGTIDKTICLNKNHLVCFSCFSEELVKLSSGWGVWGACGCSQVIVDILLEWIPVLLIVLFRYVRPNLTIQQPAVADYTLSVFFYFSIGLYVQNL